MKKIPTAYPALQKKSGETR